MTTATGIMCMVIGAMLLQWGLATARVRLFTLLAMTALSSIFIFLGLAFLLPQIIFNRSLFSLITLILTAILLLAALVEREVVGTNPEKRIRWMAGMPMWLLVLVTVLVLLAILWFLGVRLDLQA